VKPRGGYDPASLVAGLILIVLGGLLVLDQSGAIDLGAEYAFPALLAAIGGILLACGLAGPARRE
jgi:hypothetical protein